MIADESLSGAGLFGFAKQVADDIGSRIGTPVRGQDGGNARQVLAACDQRQLFPAMADLAQADICHQAVAETFATEGVLDFPALLDVALRVFRGAAPAQGSIRAFVGFP